MTDPLGEADDATPLTPEERAGLIPSHVTLCSELNELEQQNILQAHTRAFLRRRDPVGEPFGRNLHRRMFKLLTQCAHGYWGCIGVLSAGCQVGSRSVAALPSRSALRMAVTGRQNF